jgi:hypothetical protein
MFLPTVYLGNVKSLHGSFGWKVSPELNRRCIIGAALNSMNQMERL